MINEDALKVYLRSRFPDATEIRISHLGAGVQGAGFLVEIVMESHTSSYVIKALLNEGLGHDYPADRASVFLLDLESYNSLPRHVKAVDVLAESEDGSIQSLGKGKEYYLLMEKAEGKSYFQDLELFAGKRRIDDADRQRIAAMASYLASIHSVKKDSRTLYWRKLRDTVGHGECLMGVFDIYPDGVLSYEEMAAITRKCVDWWAWLKPRYRRLSQVHGDFHPGNIWFGNEGTEFILLDRSRGMWGEPADDVTALAVNFIFFSIREHGDVRESYLEGLSSFFHDYLSASGDEEVLELCAPFFAFRGAVVANPIFYPNITAEQRRLLFRFVQNVLDDKTFRFDRVNGYLR